MTNPNLFTCAKCGAEIIHGGTSTGAAGYAILPDVGDGSIPQELRRICYECSAEIERQFMRDNGHSVLYLCEKGTGYEITDWPGRLRIPVAFWRHGRRSMFGWRFDCWFMFENQVWHGIKYSNDQLIHVRRTKYTSLDKVR